MAITFSVTDFTVFSNQEFQFGDGLNVFVGENDTGKSSILKAVFSLLYSGIARYSHSTSAQEAALKSTLLNVFGIRDLAQLVQQGWGKYGCELRLSRENSDLLLNVRIGGYNEFFACCKQPGFSTRTPIFLPAQCVLSIRQHCFAFGGAGTYGSAIKEGFAPFFFSLPFFPSLENCPASLRALDSDLCSILDGYLLFDDEGKLCLKTRSGRVVNIESLGAGLRKIAVLSFLTRSGSLTSKSALIWEEPETGLSSRLIRELAKAFVALTQAGVQIFISTHSLFLLRELDILAKSDEPKNRYFGFYCNAAGISTAEGKEVFVKSSSSIDDIGEIALLDEELRQSDRYLQKEAALGDVGCNE